MSAGMAEGSELESAPRDLPEQSGQGAEPLGQAAVRRGWITHAQLRDALRQQQEEREKGHQLPLGVILLRRGWITADQLAEALRQTHHPEGAPTQMGRYLLIRKIGEGGSGEVWLAQDTTLQRQVALKVLTRYSASDIIRFRREAMLAAALDHPGIVKVYDIGEHEGRNYIAMQYIEGRTLEQENLDAATAVRAVCQAAAALEHAHSRGVIHRDVKPSNLLMDARGRVYVTDFGLARDLAGREKVSLSGTILGTPAYMSPEQARGDVRHLDGRTDVYSLGATLYYLLARRPPFEAESVGEILEKVQAQEPPRLQKVVRGIARDLDTIVGKALEKDPSRRYQSMREFREDLERHLAGQPILARRSSLTFRFARQLRRRPLVSALMGALVVVTLLVGLYVVPQLVQARRQRDLERERARRALRDVARALVDSILDTRRKGESIAVIAESMMGTLRQTYEHTTALASDDPEPDYLMGLVERALMRNERALDYQRRALAKDRRYGPALYELVVLLSHAYGEQYQREHQRLMYDRLLISTPTAAAGERNVDVPDRQVIEGRNPALRRLREELEAAARDLETAKLETLDAASVTAAGALARKCAGDQTRARAELGAAIRANPRLVECYEALADLAATLDERERWYTEGLQHDAGYVGFLVGRAKARMQRAIQTMAAGGDPAADLTEATMDAARALKLQQDSATIWLLFGQVKHWHAAQKMRERKDPLPDYAAAEQHYRKALQLQRELPEGWWQTAVLLNAQGSYLWSVGKDPEPSWKKAREDFEVALRLDPTNPEVWRARGSMWVNWTLYRRQCGSDATSEYEAAEADLAQVINLNPNMHEAWYTRGVHRFYRALSESDRQQMRQRLRQAEEDFLRARESGAWIPQYWKMSGQLYLHRWLHATPTDSGTEDEDFLMAETMFRRACEMAPDSIEFRMDRACLWSHRASRMALNGNDATAEFRRAEEEFEQVLKLNPNSTEALQARGLLRYNHAVHQINSGRGNPTEDLAKAELDFNRAISLNPELGEAWKARGNVHYERAMLAERGQDRAGARKWFAAALQDYERALKIQPQMKPEIWDKMERARKGAGEEY